MSEKDKPFTVSDRRHFTPDGQSREQDASPPEQPSGEATRVGASVRPSADSPAQAGAAGPVTFGEFVLSLGAQAGMLLEEKADDAKEAAAAIEGARQIISILEMLEDKTRDRRTADESRILEELLFQLRLGYVQRASGR